MDPEARRILDELRNCHLEQQETERKEMDKRRDSALHHRNGNGGYKSFFVLIDAASAWMGT